MTILRAQRLYDAVNDLFQSYSFLSHRLRLASEICKKLFNSNFSNKQRDVIVSAQLHQPDAIITFSIRPYLCDVTTSIFIVRNEAPGWTTHKTTG